MLNRLLVVGSASVTTAVTPSSGEINTRSTGKSSRELCPYTATREPFTSQNKVEVTSVPTQVKLTGPGQYGPELGG